MKIHPNQYSSQNEYELNMKHDINNKLNNEASSNPDYNNEEERYKTMMKFPHKCLMDIIGAAQSGIYYINDKDYLQCHFCKVVKGDWIENKDFVFKHLSKCNRDSNIPLLCNNFLLNDNLKPKYRLYESWVARLASFAGWPCHTIQTPLQLAIAGLFYTGCRDQTICFCCGETVKDWAVYDDAWVKHALLKKGQECKFLCQMKGLPFIRQVYYGEHIDTQTNVSIFENQMSFDLEDEDENRDEKLCKICYNQNKNVTFIPCGHVVACNSCATALHSCPICRSPHTNILMLHYT